MKKTTKELLYVGMDVHSREIHIAVPEAGHNESKNIGSRVPPVIECHAFGFSAARQSHPTKSPHHVA
ncbi:MAG: hypothetical protein ACR2OZ_12220 [Verrucomicrobiales bacterium]